ncbi:MAG: hypothetical protein QOE04_4893, partial [Mycobacterium sp.]|nr:hypothetical protein [Mycobacterium sp.]
HEPDRHPVATTPVDHSQHRLVGCAPSIHRRGDRRTPRRGLRRSESDDGGRRAQPCQVRLEQTRPTVAQQQRLEHAVAAHEQWVVGAYDGQTRRRDAAVQRDDQLVFLAHGHDGNRLTAP